ncbi:type VII secretion target [Nocardia mexicana]|uniref:Excreted virulence factor EspC (Type VII ESX diderm) n=1 Tax=Nocardia mexicana TaxID=279262 RepID=A0A370GPP8_9NOCA|nr:type VII secretion target [Nocardia mexicana]RDI45349.1 excreted virulence factor EspC (type VII ESX diderm) [Nocardia mexicana]
MPDGRDRINIDPAVLRDQAEHHKRAADNIRKWVEPPSEWLRTFPDQYGRIADPVHKSLENYYKARQRVGNALADKHVETSNALRDAADAYELADSDGGSNILRASEGFERGFRTPGLQSPVDDIPPSPQSSAVAPDGDSAAPALNGSTAPPGSSSLEGVDAPAPGDAEAPVPNLTTGLSTPETPDDDANAASSAAAAETPPPPVAVGSTPWSTPVAPGPAVPANGLTGDRPGAGSGSERIGRAQPLPAAASTPFAAAVAAANDKAMDDAQETGELVNEDLIAARTLLSGVLAAVGSSTPGPSWAVSVMRDATGPRLFITSNEGRGWLPAGLFLPQEVSTPWVWAETIDLGPDGAGSSWEAIADPARILAEFGLRRAASGAQLSALVSSGPIDPALRAQLGDVAMEGSVQPSSGVDLRVPGPETVDRLGLIGSADASERLTAVTNAQIRSQCVELALDAHMRVGRSDSRPEQADDLPGLRDRILATIQADFEVLPHWWEELRKADNQLAARITSGGIGRSQVAVGASQTDDSSALRGAMFERRCNELVLLLAEQPTTQRLRDSIYAHEQIVKHPLFGMPRAAVSAAPHTGYADRPRIADPSHTSAVTATPPTDPAPAAKLPRATESSVISPDQSDGAR